MKLFTIIALGILASCAHSTANTAGINSKNTLSATDSDSLKQLLDSVSLLVIRDSADYITEEHLKTKWIGFEPANLRQIELAEKRLGIILPSDYKAFLQITNGFPYSSSIEPSFLPVSEIDYLRNLDPELISIWISTGNDDIGKLLEKSILVAGHNEEQMFLLIPSSKNGEWLYWKFASWIPGEETYRNLNHYFTEVRDFLNDMHMKAAPGNNFQSEYKEKNPGLNYLYRSNGVHNYSGNWDFDSDGKKDQLFFIGEGGAHLYFYLRIQLSTTKINQPFTYVRVDMPILPSESETNKKDFMPDEMCQFAVYDFTHNGSPDIYIHLDESSFDVSRKELKNLGIHSNSFIISFDNNVQKLINWGEK